MQFLKTKKIAYTIYNGIYIFVNKIKIVSIIFPLKIIIEYL